MSWKKTIALSMELPFDVESNEIWEKLIVTYPKFFDYFENALSTINSFLLPKISNSLINWFKHNYEKISAEEIKKYEVIQDELFSYMAKRFKKEFDAYTSDEKDNLFQDLKHFQSTINSNESLHSSLPALSNRIDDLITTLNEIEEE